MTTVAAPATPRLARDEGRLAIDGGDPIVANGYVLHARWPRVDDSDVDAVVELLRSGILTEMAGRSFVQEFEAEFAAAFNARFALTANSGTAALHCAIAGVGVQAGDEVVVPALGYIACPAAVLHHQAIPIFADVDPHTYNVTPETIRSSISARTRAIMVVHLHGLPVDVDAIRAVAGPDIAVIEDFSQAVGASLRGRPVGSLASAGAASLMAGKNLPSAGEAGVLVTQSRETRNVAAGLKCFGEAVDGDGSYVPLHETMAWNYRANLLALAFASRQLFRLQHHTDVRIQQARALDEILRDTPGFEPPEVPDGATHVYHMYRFRFDPQSAGLRLTADQAREGLRQVFWAEGLPLVEFQNAPLPGHALLQQKVGYGRGCPWTCHDRTDIRYDIHDYPNALEAIQHSLVIGYPARAALASEEVAKSYQRGFLKVRHNMRAFERFASELPSQAPWTAPPRVF